MPWPYVAVSVILFGLTGLFSLAVAAYWRKLSETSNAIPARLKSAAAGLSIILVLLGLSSLWMAFLALDLG